MNIVICDDDDKVIKNVANVCRNVLSVKSKISAFHSAESLIQNLTNDEENAEQPSDDVDKIYGRSMDKWKKIKHI